MELKHSVFHSLCPHGGRLVLWWRGKFPASGLSSHGPPGCRKYSQQRDEARKKILFTLFDETDV